MLIYPTGFSQSQEDDESNRGEHSGVNQKLEEHSDKNSYPPVSTPISLASSQVSPIALDVQDNRGQHSGVNPYFLFWEIYNQLEKQNNEPESQDCIVTESTLKERLIASGKFDAGDARQTINDLVEKGELTRLEYDVLSKNSSK